MKNVIIGVLGCATFASLTILACESQDLIELRKERAAMPSGLMCFDHEGRATISEAWTECRTVRYREVPTVRYVRP